jgi:hypothetical protein
MGYSHATWSNACRSRSLKKCNDVVPVFMRAMCNTNCRALLFVFLSVVAATTTVLVVVLVVRVFLLSTLSVLPLPRPSWSLAAVGRLFFFVGMKFWYYALLGYPHESDNLFVKALSWQRGEQGTATHHTSGFEHPRGHARLYLENTEDSHDNQKSGGKLSRRATTIYIKLELQKCGIFIGNFRWAYYCIDISNQSKPRNTWNDLTSLI